MAERDYLPGPDPVFFSPDLGSALEAEQALASALAQNRQAGAAVSGVSPAQADTLMSWIVDQARGGLIETRSRPGEAPNIAEIFSPETMKGRCGLGQGLCGLQAESMGIETQSHQIHKISPEIGLTHVFSVMNVPVETPDGVTQKSFLMDTTFRQFFIDEVDVFSDSKRQPGWGQQLVQSAEGKLVADALLTKGFVELTPERAALYIGSQSFTNASEDVSTAIQVAPPPHEAFATLAKSSSTELDFDIEELADLDLRTPRLVADQAPRSAIIGMHQQQTGQVTAVPHFSVRDTQPRMPAPVAMDAGQARDAIATFGEWEEVGNLERQGVRGATGIRVALDGKTPEAISTLATALQAQGLSMGDIHPSYHSRSSGQDYLVAYGQQGRDTVSHAVQTSAAYQGQLQALHEAGFSGKDRAELKEAGAALKQQGVADQQPAGKIAVPAPLQRGDHTPSERSR